MAATQKIERLAQSIIDEATLRAKPSDIVIAKSYDANNDLLLTITGTGLSTMYILILPEIAPASGTTDALGLTQRVYTPDIIRFGWDATNTLSAVAGGLLLLASCLTKGCRVDMHSDAGITAADLITATLDHFVVSYQNLDWGYLANV